MKPELSKTLITGTSMTLSWLVGDFETVFFVEKSRSYVMMRLMTLKTNAKNVFQDHKRSKKNNSYIALSVIWLFNARRRLTYPDSILGQTGTAPIPSEICRPCERSCST
jgi:hypothetical protein